MKGKTTRMMFLRTVITVLILLAVSGLAARPATPLYAQCGGTITYGQSVTGQIARPGGSCSYSFEGVVGTAVTVRMTKSSAALDPWLDLLDPQGRVLLSDDDGAGNGNSLISIYRPTSNGAYTIVAKSYNGESAGAFVLHLGMPNGEWVSGTITRVGERPEYLFYAEAKTVVSIWMEKADGTLDPWLDLQDPTGRVLISDDDSYGSPNALISNYRLPSRGVYTIVARSYNDAGAGAFYVLLSQE